MRDGAVVLVPRCNDHEDPVIPRTATLLLQHGITMVSIDVASDTAVRQLMDAVDTLRRSDPRPGLRIGLMAGGTTATAALIAAAARAAVTTVVVYGTSCDRESDWLPALRSPAMFIVGSRETATLRTCGSAARRAVAAATIAVVSGASNSFAEPGAAEEVASLAAVWFGAQLAPQNASVSRPALSAS